MEFFVSNNRTINTTRNIVTGLLNRIISIFLPFFVRTIIIYKMGSEYAGLSNLFTAVLQVLNIADMGFNTAIVYNLYKAFANNDKEEINALVNLIKIIYRIVGIIILVLGLCLTPFITHLINGSYPNDINIYILFVLYLTNSVLSYFLFSYKETLLIADQRNDIATNIRCAFNILRYIGEFLIILLTKNFYLYLIVSVLCTALTNIFIQIVTKRRYPFIHKTLDKRHFSREQKKQITGLFISKISNTFRNSFDSIIISAMLGLTMSAIYGNYFYILNSVFYLMLEVSNAMGASVGNSLVIENEQKNYSDFKKFSLLYSWLSGLFAICLMNLYQPFMKMWVGENLMCTNIETFLFAFYFYSLSQCNIRNQYIDGTGMWWKLKFTYLLEAFVNLGLNVLLCYFWGIAGVIISTIITVVFLNYFARNHYMFKEVFKSANVREFYTTQTYYCLVFIIASIATVALCNMVSFAGVGGFALRILICLISVNFLFAIFYKLSPDYPEAKQFTKNAVLILIKRIKRGTTTNEH